MISYTKISFSRTILNLPQSSFDKARDISGEKQNFPEVLECSVIEYMEFSND